MIVVSVLLFLLTVLFSQINYLHLRTSNNAKRVKLGRLDLSHFKVVLNLSKFGVVLTLSNAVNLGSVALSI